MGTVYDIPVCNIDIGSGFTIWEGEGTSLQNSFINWEISNGLHVYSCPSAYRVDELKEGYFASYDSGVKVAFYERPDYQIGMVFSKSNRGARLYKYFRENRTRVQGITSTLSGLTDIAFWGDDYPEVAYTLVDLFPSYNDALAAINVPITYRLTNCTAPLAPTSAVVGSIVNVPISFQSGYGIVNPESDIYVTNNGVIVPSTYSNNTLTFTMPNLNG